MNSLEQETLLRMRNQLGGHAWRDSEIEELVEPKLGIITGFQQLLEQLEALRAIDLDALPPAGRIDKP